MYMSCTICLVVPDAWTNALQADLYGAGFVIHRLDSEAAARTQIASPPHLWVLDNALPDSGALKLLREIRAKGTTPVIIIANRRNEVDRVVGLELGCDDYLQMPFLSQELVLRARKILERSYTAAFAIPQLLAARPYCLNIQTREVFDIDGNPYRLTAKEFDLLLYLVRHMGRALGRDQILRRMWGEDYPTHDRQVDDLVRRLRRRLPELKLETLYGHGYRLREDNRRS